ncbi:MAG: hypothetical protein O7A68_08860 [Alphaproteobacteria bacterium]|nr:hypothetical protein [Alphaproteobacteria bacterium]
MDQVSALDEERFVERPRQRIGEQIAKVERGAMAPSAEAVKTLERKLTLAGVDGDDPGLHQGASGDANIGGSEQALDQPIRLGLAVLDVDGRPDRWPVARPRAGAPPILFAIWLKAGSSRPPGRLEGSLWRRPIPVPPPSRRYLPLKSALRFSTKARAPSA